MKNALVALSFLFFSQGFAQLKFTQKERWLFTGIAEFENKRIISGCYVTPIDSFHLKLEIDILEDWKEKEKILTEVELDISTIEGVYCSFPDQNDSLLAYRFFNKEEFEVFIALERVFYVFNTDTAFEEEHYAMSWMHILLPRKNKYYVPNLPLLHEK